MYDNIKSTASQATFKGWMDIMYAAVDSRKVRMGGGECRVMSLNPICCNYLDNNIGILCKSMSVTAV